MPSVKYIIDMQYLVCVIWLRIKIRDFSLENINLFMVSFYIESKNVSLCRICYQNVRC